VPRKSSTSHGVATAGYGSGTESLASLANLGPKSAEFLRAAGVETISDLQRLGSVAAYVSVREIEPKASLNLLWALEGALTGLHWREVAKEHRTSLLLALETHERQSHNASLRP
jgi:DNA transformation protein and related proteins